MRLNEIIVEEGFEDLFSFNLESDEINHIANMLMFKFLSEIEKSTNGEISKKQMSKLIGTSPSYITQLFRGDKLINLLTLAKFEKALNLEFDIKAYSKSEKKTHFFDELGLFLSKDKDIQNVNEKAPVTITEEFKPYKYNEDEIQNYDMSIGKYQQTFQTSQKA